MFAWQLCHNSLAMGENLVKRQICNAAICLRCLYHEEDDLLTFMHCEFASHVYCRADNS